MNPETLFCPNINCMAKGHRNAGNLVVHSQSEKRMRCTVCNKTFTATKGTVFYRLRTDPHVVVRVLTLLAYGCPLPAIVKAFELDARTVKQWWARAGVHCEAVHQHVVGESELDLEQVQADEIRVKTQGGVVWMALAMMVSTRLWLGGAVSPQRNIALIQALVNQIRAVALCRPLLLAVDGLSSYVKAFQRAFCSALPQTGKQGRPRKMPWSDVAIVQVIKRHSADGLEIERRIVQGCAQQIARLRQRSQQATGVANTAYIERLNATVRGRLAWLSRRSRTPARQVATLRAGMFIFGCVYNLCDTHHSLRDRIAVGRFGQRWVYRTPAQAAGLVDHVWTVDELLRFRVPPPRWKPTYKNGRPSKEFLALVKKWA